MTTDSRPVIVVGVDGSPASDAAVDWAAAEAVRRCCALRLVHAVDWYPAEDIPEPLPEQVVLAALARVRAGAPELDATIEHREDEAASMLIEESADASLLVVGDRGLGGFAGLLAGSVSVQAAAHAHCPVVVVRPSSPDPQPWRKRHGTGRIVVGVDGSDRSDPAVAFAFEEAALRGTGLTAVHAWRHRMSAAADMSSAMLDRPDLTDLETARIAKSLAQHRDRYPGLDVRVVVEPGNPAAVLVHESVGAALIVVGTRGYGGFLGLLLGSVSDALIRHAACPVAVVR